jgi:hypothetical protein
LIEIIFGCCIYIKWKHEIAAKQLSVRVRKASYAITTSFPANNNFSAEIMLKLYQSMIVPIITYRSDI